MVKMLPSKQRRAGRTARVARTAIFAALFPVWFPMWLVAVIGHLYCLRRGFDACCADD